MLILAFPAGPPTPPALSLLQYKPFPQSEQQCSFSSTLLATEFSWCLEGSGNKEGFFLICFNPALAESRSEMEPLESQP